MTILYQADSKVNAGIDHVQPFTQSKREAHDLAQFKAEQSRTPTKRQLALYWWAQGLPIIPVKNTRDKHDRIPLVKWTEFQTSYPTREQINEWWEKWPDANPCIVTGELSGLVVIDVDGIDEMKWLKEQGELPATRVHSRGAPGRNHFLYKHPGFNTGCPKLREGVEIKGDGGLIPCPGATHWSGATYKIVRNFPIADCPEWLVKRLTPPEPQPAEPHKPRQISGDDERAFLERHAQRFLDYRLKTLADSPPGDHFRPFKLLAFVAGWYASYGLLTQSEVWNPIRNILESNGYLKKHGARTSEKQFEHYWRRGLAMTGQPKALRRAQDWWSSKHPIQIDDNFKVTASPPDPSPTSETVINPYWPGGLSTATRAAFNRYANSAITPVLELANEAIDKGLMEPNDPVDVEFLECVGEVLGRGLSKGVIRRALNQGSDIFFSSLHLYYRSSESISQKEPKGVQKCKKPGRKKDTWVLLPKHEMLKNFLESAIEPLLIKAFPKDRALLAPARAEFLQQLGIDKDDAQRIQGELEKRYGALLESQPGYKQALAMARQQYRELYRMVTDNRPAPIRADWRYSTVAEYDVCCARAFLDAHGGRLNWTNKTIGGMLGVDPRRVDNLFRQAAAQCEPQFVDVPIRSLAHLKSIRDEWSSEHKGFPKEVVSSMRHNTFPFRNKKCEMWALNEMHQGAEIFVRFRKANQWVVVGDQPVELQKKPKEDKVTQPELFDMPATPIREIFYWWALKVKYAVIEGLRMLRERVYGLTQVERLLQMATPFKVENERIVDVTTGEIAQRTPDSMIAALVASPPPSPAQIDEATEEVEHLPWLEDILDDLLGKEPDSGLQPPSGHRTSHEGDIRYAQEFTIHYPGRVKLAAVSP